MKSRSLVLWGACICWLALHSSAATVSTLFARGYTVIPEPQQVDLQEKDCAFGPGWRLKLGSGVSSAHIAVSVLKEDLLSRSHIGLAQDGKAGTISLEIAPGRVAVGAALDRDKAALAQEAYRLKIDANHVTIEANADAGLLYGVETFIQLLRPAGGTWVVPQATIVDWPDLHVRHMYWDDAHHLDRMDELKRAIRQAAFYKINGFVLKLEGHFEYRSVPGIVEPYALTPAQYQELTDYGLRFNVQLVPYLDSPAHIAFILKHPEYKRLREYPESNYELCVTNPDSYKLLEGMFQDLMDANKGVKYFYLSTDEAYYIGLANNSQCNEAARAKELGSVGKLFAEFVDRAGKYLHDRGRTVFFWGEYPLKPEDLPSLPTFLVNGEVYGPKFDRIYKSRGIRQTIYTSSQGEEPLFPDYFVLPASKRVHGLYSGTPRVPESFEKISTDSARINSDLIGAVNAAWADAGLHQETFWLGYVSSLAAAWHPGAPDPRQIMNSFYPLFYGPEVVNMDRVYQLMSEQAQFWRDSWDETSSKWRKPIWGDSYHIFREPKLTRDQTLPLPPVPTNELGYSSEWAKQNAKRLELAGEFASENEQLLGLLQMNLPRAALNRYNLEVFQSVAGLFRQNLNMLSGIRQMDALLLRASKAANQKPEEALNAVDRALDLAERIRRERNEVLHDAEATWYKTWYPRTPEANGRRFLHELDDVKDHVPDRTTDMSYLVYREINLPLGEWVSQISAARDEFAKAHHLEPRNFRLNWQSLNSD